MADVAILDSRERVLAGILLTGGAYFLFSAQDAAIKLLVVGISVWQIMFFRSITVLAGCVAIGGPRIFADTMRSPIVRPMLLRSAFTLGAWLCYYNAARSLQLAELTTIYYAAPIIVEAEQWVQGCENCAENAVTALDYLIDVLTGYEPTETAYLMRRLARCPACGSKITEKTLLAI